MKPDEFRRRLETLFPGFGEALAGSMHAHEDGSFTPHGLCSEFSTFYVERVTDFDSPEVAELFRMVEAIVAPDRVGFFTLPNALYTCFLENISCTAAGEAGKALMGPASRAFFDGWHGPPPYSR